MNVKNRTIILDNNSFENESYLIMCEHIGNNISKIVFDFTCDYALYKSFLEKVYQKFQVINNIFDKTIDYDTKKKEFYSSTSNYISLATQDNKDNKQNYSLKYNISALDYDDVQKDFLRTKDVIYSTTLYYNSAYFNQEILDWFETEIKDTMDRMGHDKSHFYLIRESNSGLKLEQCPITNEYPMDIKLNYGKEFHNKYEYIIDVLKNKYKGIVLFYGQPGTGKSSFLRYMITQLCNFKSVIYVPSNMMYSISNPEFISLVRQNSGSILILEDAESVIQERDGSVNDQAISNILNLTDGILNDALKIQVIATFNTVKENIDQALLRSGRLIDAHEFTALTAEQANKVAKSLGKEPKYTKPTTLSEIYDEFNAENKLTENSTNKIKKKKPTKVGFVQ